MKSASGGHKNPRDGGGKHQATQTHEVQFGGRCQLRCAVCDCHQVRPDGPLPALPQESTRLVLRGCVEKDPRFGSILEQARAGEHGEVVLRTNALAFREPAAAAALMASGVDAVLIPIFSQNTALHGRIAGHPEALVQTLVGMRALARAGLGIEIEIPLLSPRLQNLEAVVELAYRAVPSLRSVRFFLPLHALPSSLAPPSWDEVEAPLAAAIRRCRALGVRAKLRPQDGIPLCALHDSPELHDAYAFPPRTKVKIAPGATREGPCSDCAVREQCAGSVQPYREANGSRGLRPYKQKPRAMYAQRTEGAPVFTAEHHRASAKVNLLVLRPTVNCNQDCAFCSANETSNNVWSDSDQMLKAISRAARRGIQRLSFSGGEPTLSRELPLYIETARRLEFQEIELVTNGVLLDREDRVKRLRDAGLTHAFVSLHAYDEQGSMWITRKSGDHERTVRAVHLLLAAGVRTVINHVITTRNYALLKQFVEFMHREFQDRVRISFAFITPQYKALENFSLVPKLSDVIPHLRLALRRALELGIPFSVGSRQGIPPCFLKEFAAWSDLLNRSIEAASEDAPQKQRAEVCDSCRYTHLCNGLWRRYVAAYGLSELVPMPGPPILPEELAEFREGRGDLFVPSLRTFEDVPERLRDREAEREGLSSPAPAVRSLPVISPGRSRPVRLAMAGSGPQARRIAQALARVPELSLDAVASPHALALDLRSFGGCPGFPSLASAIDEIRPEGVVIAAATPAHYDLARLALEQGVPTLIEKPFTRTEAEAEALVMAAEQRPETPLIPAHNMVFSPGMEPIFEASHLPEIAFLRRCTPSSPEALHAWGRAPLSEVLYHALSVVGYAAGGGSPEIASASFLGESSPERVELRLVYPEARASVIFDFAANEEETRFSRGEREGAASRVWRRVGPQTTLLVDGHDTPFLRDGNDLSRMLAHFRDVILGRASAKLSARAGLEVLRATLASIAALDQAGAPFDRIHAPRHAASPALAAFPKSR